MMYMVTSNYVNGMAYKADMYSPIIDAADQCRRAVEMHYPVILVCDKTIGSFVLNNYNESGYSINSNYSIDRVI